MDNFETSIDLSPPQPSEGGIRLEQDTQPKVTPGILATRASKANLGLSGILQKSKEDIEASINGNEDGFRKEAASTLDYNKTLQKQNLVSQILRSGGEVDPKKLSEFMTPGPATDPKSVIEENYGRQFVSPIMDMSNQFMKETFMASAIKEIPKQVEDAFNAGADLAAKGEFARTMRDNMEAIRKQQSWGMWGVQTASKMIPEITEATFAGQVPEVPKTGAFLLMGSNLEAQRKALWNLPFPEFKERLTSILDSLKKDPTLATEYAHAIVGQSTEDETLNNQQSLMDLSVLGGPLLKAAKGVLGLSKKVELLGEVQSAVKDVVKSTAEVRDSPVVDLSPEEYAWENEGGALGKTVEVVHPDSRGDIGEAAVKQAASNTLKDITHTSNPTSRAIAALPSVYKKDQRGVKANPGNFGQEGVNRLGEETATHLAEITQVIENNVRVNKAPEFLASEDAQRAYKEKIKDDHPELDGHILNITGPHWNKAINGFEHYMILGKHNAEFFRSYSEAQNWARLNRIPLQTTAKTSIEKQAKGPTRILSQPDEKIVPGARIRSKGFGYYVEKSVPVDMRSDIVRNTFGTTEFSKLPHSIADNWLDAAVGWLRTPDETMSMDDRMNRKMATTAPSNFLEVARAALQDIARIAPASQVDKTRPAAAKRWDQWSRMVHATKDMKDPATGDKGYDFKSPGEIDNFYMTHYNRLPEEAEIAAYFAFKRINLDDYMYRALSTLRNKHNVGAQAHQFEVTGPDGKQMSSPWVDGVRLNELPGGRDTIAVFKRDVDHTHLMPANMMGKARDEVAEEVKTGRAMVFEIYDPDTTPLKGFGPIKEDDQVRYVVARGFRTRPLDILGQINRRGGGHMEYDYPAYLKQADIVQDPTTKRFRYRGDKTALALPNSAMGEDFAKKLNALHPHIEAGNITEAQRLYESYFQTGNIPSSWEDHYANYLPTKDSKGNITKGARWNTKEPFVVVPRDQMIADVPLLRKAMEERYMGPDKDNPMFEDGTRHGSLARQNQIQYTGQRDAYEIQELQDVGKRHNPVYKYAPAKTIDSIPMQMRALARIVNDYAGITDQKMFAVEHWLFGDADGKGNGAEHYIDAPKSDIRYSPFYYYNNYKLRKGTPVKEQLLIDQQHYKSKAFAGIPSIIDNFLTSAAQKLADSIYTKTGPAFIKERTLPTVRVNLLEGSVERVGKKFTLDPTWMLPMLSNGPRFIRSMVFHPKMGLFNPAMFSVHISTYFNTSVIAGLRPASGGAFATLLHGFTKVNANTKVLKYMDELASSANFGGYNFKPGEWLEARQGLLNYGGHRVEFTQLSDLDNPTSTRILATQGSKFLDAGLIPFKAGITPVKIASWYVAYLERRNGGGGKFNWQPMTGRMTDSDWAQIGERQDLLAHNMTRASTSIVQKGLASFGMMFGGYDVRVLEMLTGKRLTWQERARLFGAYFSLYGVRATTGIVGLASIATQTANDKGYVPGSDFTSTLIMEGLLAAGIGVATGGGDIRKGNIYNIGQRFGMRDLSIIDGFLDGDKTIWNIFGGAPFSELSNTWAASSGFRNWGVSMLRGDGKFQLTPEHILDMLREISSVNAADRAYWGAVAGRWVSRNGRTISSNVTGTNALVMALSGLQEQRFADVFPKGQEIKRMKEMESKAFGLAVKEAARGFQSLKDNDPQQASKYFLNARFYMEGYPENKQNEVISAARKENKDLVDGIDFDRYMGKELPMEQREKAMKTYQDILRMNKEKRQ